MTEHKARVAWRGNVDDGSGTVLATTGAFCAPVRSRARLDGAEEGETTPEELIAAAHAVCFTMALEATLAKHCHGVHSLETECTVSVERENGGVRLTRSWLRVRVRDTSPGLDAETWRCISREAESACALSNALRGNVQIVVDARKAP